MIHAELKGKLTERNPDQREDILTSNVFSFFEYVDHGVFLYELLRSWRLGVSLEEARAAEFHYWPQFADGTEPDLVILVGQYYLLIEAKYRSGFGRATPTSEDQLTREMNGGTVEAADMRKTFKLIAVTAHPLRAHALAHVPDPVGPILQWTNWQQIGLLVRGVRESKVSFAPETRVFAEDLCELLASKGLRGYGGLAFLGRQARRIAPVERVFFNARSASFRGSFLGFLASLSSEAQLAQLPPQIFFRPRGGFLSAPGEKVRSPIV